MELKENYPLAPLTTVKAGGCAELFARVGSVAQLVEAVSWADSAAKQLYVVGSGSNLLVADGGVSGLVIKLSDQLAAVERSGSSVNCGGGVRLPSLAAYCAREGLSGLEFGVNIPGTVGGAVRMNANAYGGELAKVLTAVTVVSKAGVKRLTPQQLGFSYRSSTLSGGEVVASADFELKQDQPQRIKQQLASLRDRRKAAQPSGIKTFGSTFKNPTDPKLEGKTAGQLLDLAGCRELMVGGARFSEKHANFVENVSGATTADILALMSAGRWAVYRRFGVELEPEVQLLGDVALPSDWELR